MKIRCPNCLRVTKHVIVEGYTMVPKVYLEQLESLYTCHGRSVKSNGRFCLAVEADHRNEILESIEETVAIYKALAPRPDVA